MASLRYSSRILTRRFCPRDQTEINQIRRNFSAISAFNNNNSSRSQAENDRRWIRVRAQVRTATKLAMVGKLEQPRTDGNYDTGQTFLHKVFGYRGVILFPWTARVYDRDVASKRDNNSGTNLQDTAATFSTARSMGGEVEGKTQTYYQVLIDNRDSPHITHRAHTESVTFLGNPSDNTGNLYAIPDLDYVSHDDILPYSTKNDETPIQHELFDKFLEYRGDVVDMPKKKKKSKKDQAKDESKEDSTEEKSSTESLPRPQFEARETLQAWQEGDHPWLELSDVHIETTEDIKVTVIPFYMGYRESQSNNVYWWRYSIRLENMGEHTVQLRERNWRIFSLSGTLETVRGRGVVGQEPLLSKVEPAFQYCSHVSLQAPSGHMWGTFRMERSDGHAFDCRIPPFSLESKQDSPENQDPPILGV